MLHAHRTTTTRHITHHAFLLLFIMYVWILRVEQGQTHGLHTPTHLCTMYYRKFVSVWGSFRAGSVTWAVVLAIFSKAGACTV